MSNNCCQDFDCPVCGYVCRRGVDLDECPHNPIDLSAYVTEPMDFTGCDPVIEAALRNGHHVKAKYNNRIGSICSFVPGHNLYVWVRDDEPRDTHTVPLNNFLTLIPNNTPRKGDGKLYMFWDEGDKKAHHVGEYGYRTNGIGNHYPIDSCCGWDHCAVADLELLKHPISEWKKLRPNMEVF